MASMNKQWQQVQRDNGVQEYYMNGQFITSDQWESSCPPNFYPNNYPYHKDGIAFNGNIYGSDIKNEIRVTEIIHVTTCENALSIIKDCGFRPGTKDIPDIGEMDLVWFGLNVGEAEIYKVRENYKRCVYPLQHGLPASATAGVADSVASQFANTAPFQPMSRYGNVKFTLGIKTVLEAYKRQFCTDSGVCYWPEMRKLGTFAYKQETMHVIIFCPPGTPKIDHCPVLRDYDRIIQPDWYFETWAWRPHSTGEKAVSVTPTGYISSLFKRWEHVTFAFVVPKGGCLQIHNLNHHVSLCLHQTKEFKVVSIHKAIIDMLDLIQREEDPSIRVSRANLLIRIIRGYIDEMPLYEKTVNSDLLIGKLTVDLKWVVLSFQGMLPMEFAHLNFSPLQ